MINNLKYKIKKQTNKQEKPLTKIRTWIGN